MKILAIGNSFSQDAFAYLHDMAEGAGFDTETLNLYIGGCSLETHAYNIFYNKPYYHFEFNGKTDGGRQGSIQEALTRNRWDYISLQQVSGSSGMRDTYYPYLDRIADRVKTVCPDAKLLIHQTWAYDVGSDHGSFANYNNDQKTMHKMLTECYREAAERIGAYKIIPTGDVIAALRSLPEFDLSKGGESLCRDTYHLSCSYGRYAAAAAWFESLGMGDILTNPYLPPVDGIEPEKIALIKETVKSVCGKA